MNDFSTEKFFDLSTFKHSLLFKECTHVWEGLLNIQSYLSQIRLGINRTERQDYAYLINPETIFIDEGTIIEPGAYIKGPCIIGKNCHIRHGAYIRGDVIIGDRCVIGHDTEVKHSILFNDAHAAHFAYVGDSILGNHINLGAGVKCANLKLNGSEVKIATPSGKITTHLRKLGAIVGDYSQIGCNTVLNPGTIIGKSVQCHPCLNIGGIIAESSLVKPKTTFEVEAIKR